VTKTQYFTATSVDGYIADADNSLDFPRRLTSKRIRLESARQDGQQVQLVYSVGAP
jgi:hypothetical protein